MVLKKPHLDISSKTLSLNMLPRPVALTSSGSFLDTLNLPSPELPKQNMHFNKNPSWFLCTLVWEALYLNVLFCFLGGSFHLFSYFFLIFELYNNDTPLVVFCFCFVHRLFLRFIQIALCSHSWLHDTTFALIFFLDKHLSVPDMFVPVCLLCTQG